MSETEEIGLMSSLIGDSMDSDSLHGETESTGSDVNIDGSILPNMDPEPDSSTEESVEVVAAVTPPDNNVLMDSLCVTVSDVIRSNVNKHINTVMLNDMISAVHSDCDLVNYIVYINNKKNIPCIFDCEKLVVPKSSVMDSTGAYKIESIEGRRSGFVIKMESSTDNNAEACYNRHLVMSKNFIYDIKFNVDGSIESVYEYNRKHQKEHITTSTPQAMDYDCATLAVRNVLPKIVRNGKCTTIEQLREEVTKSYNAVDDVNALFKIVSLMLDIGC